MKNCPVCFSRNPKYFDTVNRIELLKCQVCHHVYANISDDSIEKANQNPKYPNINLQWYIYYNSFFKHAWFEDIVERFAYINTPRKVLDIGCGNGLLLKKFIDAGWEAEGIDSSDWALEFSELYHFKLYSGLIGKINIEKNQYDLIVSTSTLEHIPQPTKFTEYIISLLKPGGFAYFVGMPNHFKPLSKTFVVSEVDTPPWHVNFFSNESLQHMMSIESIESSIKFYTIDSYGIQLFFDLQERLSYPTQWKKVDKQMHDNFYKSEIPPPWLKSIGKIGVKIYYYSGKLFNLGDKLELVLQKCD